MCRSTPLQHASLRLKLCRPVCLLPCLYNYYYRRACVRILANRSMASTLQAWAPTKIPWPVIQKVSEIIASEYYWPREALFLPEDECWVLFCFWRRQLSDGLELPSCILRLQEDFNVELPEGLLLSLAGMSFGAFCNEVLRLIQDVPSPEC